MCPVSTVTYVPGLYRERVGERANSLIVAREKHRVRVVMPRGAGWFGDEICLEPPDGGECEPVLHGGHSAGDFPPYFPVK